MSDYKNCVENNLVPRVKVMVIRCLKFKNYNARVKIGHVIQIRSMYVRTK